MTHKERLERIEKEINHLDGGSHLNDNLEDIEYLLTRVRVLTEALEKVVTAYYPLEREDAKDSAIEALAEEEE